MAQNLNYVGSSGYGLMADGRYGRISNPPKPPTSGRQDYGVFDATQNRVVSILTGQPWNGVEPRTGTNYSAGQPSAQSANTVNAVGIGPVNPNDPNQVFRPFTLPKDPAMEASRQQLIQEFSTANQDALTGVADYLKGFEDQMNASAVSMDTATDPTEAIARLNAAQAGYNTELDASNAAYQRAMAEQAAGMRGVVEEAQGDLTGYNTAQDAVKNDQLQQYLRGWKLTKMQGTNAPSGYDSAILAREAARASIPIELAKQERKYDILRSMALPTEQNLGANAIAYASGFLPGIASSRFSANTSVPIQIQNLLQQTAGMKLDAAIKFMQGQAVPAEVINRIIQMQIANASGLTQLGDATQYRGVHNVLGANVSQPVGYNMYTGPLPDYSRPVTPTTSTRTTPSGPPGAIPGVGTPTSTPYVYDTGGVQYRPITGAPGGRPFDYGSYYSQFQPNWQGPMPYPVSYAHSTPNVSSQGRDWSSDYPENYTPLQ